MKPHKTLPLLAEVIIKVKKNEPLCAEEELIYLIHIEGLAAEDAKEIVANTFDESEHCD